MSENNGAAADAALNGALFGTDLFGDTAAPKAKAPLEERFLIPPFTVLSARDGDWQDRKRAWLSLGIRSELGRGTAAAFQGAKGSDFAGDVMAARGGVRNSTMASGSAMKLAGGFDSEAGGGDKTLAGTSIFDPVLCELAYRWFCPLGGIIVDPFAGGSVRGVVAGFMGRHYLGFDLRGDQVEANYSQAYDMAPPVAPVWRCADSADPANWGDAPKADFAFSCPPYGDLEVYSDEPGDLSNMPWPQFCAAYACCIANAVDALKPDRFAAFVVGDFRDPKGLYRNFVSTTIACFEAAGAMLYNEAIYVTPAGSLPIRATKQFEKSRKLGKTHQNLLIFVKGNPEAATEACQAGRPYTPSHAERQAQAAEGTE